jgi:phytol kinase
LRTKINNLISWFERKFFKISFKNSLLVAFIWLLVGFTTGTETLMGPVRWVARLSRNMEWDKRIEDSIVKLIIILFVISSFIISLWLARAIIKTTFRHVKAGILALILLATVSALYFWMNPQIFIIAKDISEETTADRHFTFGTYPTEEQLIRLKKEGYTAVISLLHPAVVPFEPKLLADEQEVAKKVGIAIIHLPMLPWVSENRESLDKIKAIAESSKGRYYVHCYLGKDRINVVKRVIEKTKGAGRTEYAEPDMLSRKIRDIEAFERGKIFILDDEVYLTPYPTDEEFMGFILSGSINHVVSLLDPENPKDVPWIEKEQELLAKHYIGFDLFPVSYSHYNPQKVLEVAQKVRFMPKPLVIHGFLSPSFVTVAFIQAFRSNLLPLPPSFFKEPLRRGEVKVIAPNIAIGPRPDGPEFGNYLYSKGIRRFAYLGNPNSVEAKEDSIITKEVGLDWQTFEPYSPDLFDNLATGGPWYVYGPFLSTVRKDLENRFGPAIPESIKFDLKELEEVQAQADQIEGQPKLVQEKEQPKPKGIIAFTIDFLEHSLPDLKMIIILGPLFLLYTGIGGAFTGWLRMSKNVQTPYTRKVFHFYIFTMAGILQLSAGLSAVVLFGVIVTICVLYAIYRGNNFPFYEAMARPTDKPHRTFFIVVPLIATALGGGFANLFFSKFAYVGYFVGGWGDAVGEPIGVKWGRHKYKVPSFLGVRVTRSLEGSAAIFAAGFIGAFLGLFVGGIPFAKALLAGLACGITGTIVEAISTHGLDNFTIQIVAAATAYLLLS